ncbi:MAG: hypothetical protein AAF805_00360 [Planctomycetota bacterium]
MSLPFPLAPVLAQRSNWSRLGDRFSGDHLRLQTEDLVGVLALVAVAVVLLLTLRMLAKWQQSQERPATPKQLFKELAAAHGLGHGERAELRRVAGEAGLSDASEVFVRPDLRGRLADRSLAERLFGGDS